MNKPEEKSNSQQTDVSAYQSLLIEGGALTKRETKSTVFLQHHLKSLKWPTMLREREKIASRCAGDNVDHLSYLL